MSKRKKEAKGKGSGHAVASVNAVSKDIDDIFAKRAVSKTVVSKPLMQSTESQKAEASAPTALVAIELSNVQKKVTAARAAKPAVISSSRVNDAFADIRGTKKSRVQSG